MEKKLNEMTARIFGWEKEVLTEGLGNLHSEVLHALHEADEIPNKF
jgi:hypothetical protein